MSTRTIGRLFGDGKAAGLSKSSVSRICEVVDAEVGKKGRVEGHIPVVEFGLVGETMHQADERVPEEDVLALKRDYRRILESYFA